MVGAMRTRVVIAIVAGAALCALFGWLGRAHGTGFNYEVAAGVATAFGTLALALATYGLVASTREDVAGTRRLAQLAEQEQAGQLRPCVYPYAGPELTRSGFPGNPIPALPLQNGGPGLALNVTGHVYWQGGDAEFVSTTLAGGERASLPLRTLAPAGYAWGRISYRDVLGHAWETRFMIDMGADFKLLPEVRAYGYADRLPPYEYPKGWELNNGAPWLAIDPPE
jgi:hypothetical protein